MVASCLIGERKMPTNSREENSMSKYNVYVEDVSVEAVFNKLGGVEGARRFLAGELILTESPKSKPVPEPVGLDAFFKTREGLWVSDSFRNLVVAKVSPGVGRAVATKSKKLDHNMTDEQIEAMLGDGHIFGDAVLCDTLKKMIQEQWGGKKGRLLNNGYANLLYLGSCVVRVYWCADFLEWRVIAWRRDDVRWGAGLQVFSPATTA